MSLTPLPALASTLVLLLATGGCAPAQDAARAHAVEARADGRDAPRGWLSWRGPQQNGTSLETGLPRSVAPAARAWTYRLAGRGTPVVAGGRLYGLGYEGTGPDLQEILFCLDAATGRRLWEHRFTDFLTDIIYHRFSISSPTIDPETGNVLCMSSAGLLSSFTPDGELRWQHDMMAEYGRLTFPNGRTGAPLVDGDLVIVHEPTSGWGAHAPARDRFYAFDKHTGESVWSCTPGGPPKDASFSFPVLAEENGRRVAYACLADGNLACVDVGSGDPLWRFQMSIGGASSSPLLYGDAVIAVHGKENLDSSILGRMVAVRRGAEPAADGPRVLGRDHERWRNDLVSFSSSPVLVGNRVYVTVHTGELCCVDADRGTVLWHHKLAPDQIHASPVWGDGVLYVPMNNGSFHLVRPTDEGPEILQQVQLEGSCLGAPAIAGGRVYVHTTAALYCFGAGTGRLLPPPPRPPAPAAGPAVRLQVIPADVVLRPGESVPVRVRSLDARGRLVSDAVRGVRWSDLPARGVAAAEGTLRIARDAPPAAVVARVEADGLRGQSRIRIVRAPPYTLDFEDGVLPAEWAGALGKWEVVERDGGRVLARTLDVPLFQRSMSFVGHPDQTGYTTQVDVLTDGNRRIMSSGGLVHQRYLIALKGNHQELEVSSNVDLLKVAVPFRWRPGVWYRLKARVDVAPDGSGRIRAKAWQRDQPEPAEWTIDVPHAHAHTHGTPGIWGFTPQSRFRVYLDNFSVTPDA